MKKTIAFVSALLISCVSSGMAVFAEDESSVKVNVTISDKDGKLVMVQETIDVTDIDNDGTLTINDALYLAHEAGYEGGAAAGYASSVGTYGLAVDKLWGAENGGSYGYYVNNTAAMGLTDTLSSGDYLNAFVYTDLTGWSDSYSFFDVNTAETEQGSELSFTLSRAGYDADWNPVTLAVEGAVISINGEPTEFVTDSEGKVTVRFESAGEKLISASSDSLTLVPPVCVVNVAESEEVQSTTEVSEETSTETSTEETTENITETSTETTTETVTTGSTETTSNAVSSTSVSTSAGSTTATAAASTTKSASNSSSSSNASSSPKTGDKTAGAVMAVLGASALIAAVTVKRNEE